MVYLVFAVNPTLAAWGQFAAIIICFYVLIFVVLAVAFNLAMALGFGWVREKIEIIKRLRPTVDSLNETTELAVRGVEPGANTNKIIRSIAEAPATIHTIDKKVDEGADRVAQYVIEFRARTEQVKAIAETLFLPGRAKQLPERVIKKIDADAQGLEFNSPGSRMLTREQAPNHRDVPSPSPDTPVQAPPGTDSQLNK